MQFSHFTSPPKTNSELSKLGIKVLRNRSRENEDSGKSPDEGPPITRGVDLSQARLDSHSGLDRSGGSVQENCVGTGLKVTSQTETHDKTEDRLSNELEPISSIISISQAKENHKSGIEMSDNLTLNADSSISSLVCCDYTDSSDASDDLT